VDVFGADVDWVAICPEVEIGLGTPRETIDLVRVGDGDVRLLQTIARVDLTDRMREYAAARVDGLAALALSGYVLKADSPSCGPSGVPIAGGVDTGRGLFAAALIDRFPDLPIVDERALDDPARREAFCARVRARHLSTGSRPGARIQS
jgi:uncharacterized protein YbbK (DUF523 family)